MVNNGASKIGSDTSEGQSDQIKGSKIFEKTATKNHHSTSCDFFTVAYILAYPDILCYDIIDYILII